MRDARRPRWLPPWRQLLALGLGALALALLPWWLGLPLLIGLAAGLLTTAGAGLSPALQRRLRLALRWGLAGVAVALARAAGEPALAWTVGAVAVLAGYTALAGLEAWLDRDLRRAPPASPAAAPTPEWPELALAPLRVGGIVTLASPAWQRDDGADPRGGRWRREGPAGYRLGDGLLVEAPAAPVAFSPDGRWFAVQASPGPLLFDRDVGQAYPLRRGRLAGWHDGTPWLQDDTDAMPHPFMPPRRVSAVR